MERLSKRLAASGVASRRHSEDLITAGRVTVNGVVALKPETRVTLKDVIKVDGKKISEETKVYYVLNKPRGLICTSTGSRSILSLFPTKHRLFSVGRLDKDTEGLLLVTNDGIFANNVIHPSKNTTKEYLVKTDEDISHEHLVRISQGVTIDGVKVKPVKVKKVRRGTVKVTVSEGKKHEVRLLMEAAGLDVIELKRIRIGSLQLGSLPVGSWRPLKESEKQCLEAP